MQQIKWWERRWFFSLLIVLSTVPLLWPQTPPLVDLPGHLARYRVQLDLSQSENLRRYFDFQWMLIGNLGVDLLIEVTAPLIGLETAAKLIAISIPPLTVGGLLWVSREVHGRVPPTAMFALPFVYSYPFNFGFINFSLSLALALISFGAWLYLTRLCRLRLRALLFVPVSCLLWLCHVFGWGVLGLLAFSAEFVRMRDSGIHWQQALPKSALAMLPLSPPALLMIFWRSGAVTGQTDHFFMLADKLFSLVAALRDRWLIWDSVSVGAALVLVGATFREPALRRSRRLMIPAVVLFLTFCLMPARIFGSAYADMRLAPLMIMLTLLSIKVVGPLASQRTLALLGIVFFLLRIGGNTISFAIADRELRQNLSALKFIPMGSPVVFLTGDYCHERWKMPRLSHAGSFVVLRREGFSNDQFQEAGAQLIRIVYSGAGYFRRDPSHLIYAPACYLGTDQVNPRAGYSREPNEALAAIPRNSFDFVWVLDLPDYRLTIPSDFRVVWRINGSALYQIEKSPDRP